MGSVNIGQLTAYQVNFAHSKMELPKVFVMARVMNFGKDQSPKVDNSH